jgi:hypothetical protein
LKFETDQRIDIRPIWRPFNYLAQTNQNLVIFPPVKKITQLSFCLFRQFFSPAKLGNFFSGEKKSPIELLFIWAIFSSRQMLSSRLEKKIVQLKKT